MGTIEIGYAHSGVSLGYAKLDMRNWICALWGIVFGPRFRKGLVHLLDVVAQPVVGPRLLRPRDTWFLQHDVLELSVSKE